MNLASKRTYQEVSAVARKRRDANIAAYYPTYALDKDRLPNNLAEWALRSGHYTNEELEIIQSDAVDILQKIRDQIWTALEVTKAFCKASALAQELVGTAQLEEIELTCKTNCLTEILYPEALERARYLDEYLQRTGLTIGPLHGLPISLKDCFVTAPHPSSIGLAALANEPTSNDSMIVELLRKAGAVFYVKTNTPTAMMMAETINNVWGETISPIHSKTSPGGSSGGESALIAFKASPLGIGTDVAGSIRIPAAWCRLYGLKPSAGRFPTSGIVSGIPGQEFIQSVNGPMSSSLSSVRLYCETMLSEQLAPWTHDHKCLPLPWRQHVLQPKGKRLRLGLIGSNDGLVTCHPPVERALNVVKTTLEAAGHDIVPWSVELHPLIVKNQMAAFFDLGGVAIMDKLIPAGEPIFGSMQGYATAAQAGEADLGPTKVREMVIKRNELQQAYVNQWNASTSEGQSPIDGIIMAVSPWAAPRLGQTQKDLYLGYTSIWNFLGEYLRTVP